MIQLICSLFKPPSLRRHVQDHARHPSLDKAALPYAVRAYDYDPDAEQIGVHAAESLGVPADTVLKTLMATVDGKPVCLLIPSDREASMKRVADAFGGKSAAMMRPADAERLTGYHVGGISPFGQKRRVPTALDASAMGKPRVFVNGGQRGLQIELRPDDIVALLQPIVTVLTA